MRALLLAAGHGTRLRPLTDHIPKCLVPIHGRPLLDYWLEALLDHGADEVLINTHYLAPMVREYVTHSSWHSRAELVHEKDLLGTAGTVLRNRDFFGGQPLLVAHADNLCGFSFAAFRAAHDDRPKGTELTMMLFETPTPESCGIVERDDRGVIRAFHEKVPSPPGRLANAAVYIMEPSVIGTIEATGMSAPDISLDVIPRLIGRIATWENTVYHRDIGTLQSWRQAHQDFVVAPPRPENDLAWERVIQLSGQDLSGLASRMLAES